MTNINDYAKLKSLKDIVGSFIVDGVDMETREVKPYAARVVFSDHISMLHVHTSSEAIVCPATHRFLTTKLLHPFKNVNIDQLSWIKAIDLTPGIFIAEAPVALCQPPNIYQDHYTVSHKICWQPVTKINSIDLFENFGVEVFENDNYIMNNILNKSYAA